MQNPIYFQADKFADQVIKDMNLLTTDAAYIKELKQEIINLLGERIISVLIDHFGPNEVERFEKLMDDHPEISEMDAMILMAPEIPGLKEDLEKQVDSLHQELLFKSNYIYNPA